jgi:hypothetical protein
LILWFRIGIKFSATGGFRERLAMIAAFLLGIVFLQVSLEATQRFFPQHETSSEAVFLGLVAGLILMMFAIAKKSTGKPINHSCKGGT